MNAKTFIDAVFIFAACLACGFVLARRRPQKYVHSVQHHHSHTFRHQIELRVRGDHGDADAGEEWKKGGA